LGGGPLTIDPPPPHAIKTSKNAVPGSSLRTLSFDRKVIHPRNPMLPMLKAGRSALLKGEPFGIKKNKAR